MRQRAAGWGRVVAGHVQEAELCSEVAGGLEGCKHSLASVKAQQEIRYLMGPRAAILHLLLTLDPQVFEPCP